MEHTHHGNDPDRLEHGKDHKMDHTIDHKHHSTDHKGPKILTPLSMVLLGMVLVILIINQVQIQGITKSLGAPAFMMGGSSTRSNGNVNLAAVEPVNLKSTAHTVAAVFPVDTIKTSEDALAVMFPSGTPEYGEALGVTYDDPVTSLSTLAAMYRGLKAEVEKNDPEAYQRFLALASLPVGISCEYCCGIGPVGIDKSGNSACGCQHNPALLSVALYLTAYTDYSEGEILYEVMKWKTLFFPKNMVELGLSVAGSDPAALDNLPGMVGGC